MPPRNSAQITMAPVRYPSLYQINTRVYCTEFARALGRRATLDDIPDAELDRLSQMGFDWVWLLSVWQTGEASRTVSRTQPEWRKECQETLPDLREEDIAGSGFAITAYRVHEQLGGDTALARLRERLRKRGLRLMLDFVPNHTGLDHPWTLGHADYYVSGTEADLAREPANYTRLNDSILAHGRDPYFSGWTDTLQLNYGNPAVQRAMAGELLKIAGQCDGVRCDMAMLVLPEVFQRTWGGHVGRIANPSSTRTETPVGSRQDGSAIRPTSSQPFWPKATQAVRKRFPDFCFLAEVYWDLEWTLQQQGFDYTYDKRLYDRLRAGQARPVREHLAAGLDYQSKLARFLENHDEPRAATAFPSAQHQAAAVITYLLPGLRFFHQGQFEGRRKRITPHLSRGPDEPIDSEPARFYERLRTVLRRPAVREGRWQLLECTPAWKGNRTCNAFVVFAWQGADEKRLIVAVNYSAVRSQCYVRLPFQELGGEQWRLQDLMGDATYEREGDDLQTRGLYLDEPAWSACVFSMTKRT